MPAVDNSVFVRPTTVLAFSIPNLTRDQGGTGFSFATHLFRSPVGKAVSSARLLPGGGKLVTMDAWPVEAMAQSASYSCRLFLAAILS